MLEKQIEAAVSDYARGKGFLVYKFTSPNRAAVPDKMFIALGGKVFFIEFKATGKKLTIPQQREHARLHCQGVPVYVVDDVNKGKDIIDGYNVYAEKS